MNCESDSDIGMLCGRTAIANQVQVADLPSETRSLDLCACRNQKGEQHKAEQQQEDRKKPRRVA
jgi:hypothetical protein